MVSILQNHPVIHLFKFKTLRTRPAESQRHTGATSMTGTWAGCAHWVSHLNWYIFVLQHCNSLFFLRVDPCQRGPRSRWSIGISLRQVFCQVGCSVSDWQLAASVRHQHEPFLRQTAQTHSSTWLNEHATHWAVTAVLMIFFFLQKPKQTNTAAALEFWHDPSQCF